MGCNMATQRNQGSDSWDIREPAVDGLKNKHINTWYTATQPQNNKLLSLFDGYKIFVDTNLPGIHKLDAGWPESEEGQVGNVKLEEEVERRSNEDNLVK